MSRRRHSTVRRRGAARWDAHPARRSSPAQRIGVGVLVLVVAGSLAVDCTSVRNALGTRDSNCYVALPAASAAVHDAGHLRGVQLATVGSLRNRAPLLYGAARRAPGPAIARVCLVAYTGTFISSAVDHPIGRPSGLVAVVELAYPANTVVATLIEHHPSIVFGHLHIGLP